MNKKITSVYLIIILCIFSTVSLFIPGCSDVKNTGIVEADIEKGKVNNISAEKAYEIISNNDGTYFLLDVRSQEEYKEGHIKDSVLIPVSDLKARLAEVPEDRVILVYCRSGSRSLTAANILIENGFSSVFNMEGGITDWINKGYPEVTD